MMTAEIILQAHAGLKKSESHHTGLWRRLLCASLLALLLLSNLQTIVLAQPPVDPEATLGTTSPSTNVDFANKPDVRNESIIFAPPQDVIDEPEMAAYCPSGSGLYCYLSIMGGITVADHLNTIDDNTLQETSERALQPNGYCKHDSHRYTEAINNRSGGFAYVVYDLGEVFEISKFISRDLHHGNWWIQYSEDGQHFSNFDFGQTNWLPSRCTSYLYDRSASPVRARYIKYMVQEVGGVGNAYRIAWFSFLTSTRSSEHPPVQNPTIASDGDPKECPLQGEGGTGCAGDPINTLTGGYSDRMTDLTLSTAAGPLEFTRTYSTGALSLGKYTPRVDTALGYGWTHNHDIRLIFTPTNEVWFKSQSANQYLFTENQDGTFTPYTGITASLSFDSQANEYVLVDSAQNTYTFDDEGKVQRWQTATGQAFEYSYQGGFISQVTDPSGLRYLNFSYTNGLISGISDHSGRSVSYSYDSNDNLTSFIDVLGNTWTYTYDNAHRLTSITLTDPADPTDPQTKLRNLYDSQGRVVCQQEGDESPALTQFTTKPIKVANEIVGGVVTQHVVTEEVTCKQANGIEAAATTLSYNDDGTVNVKDANGNVTTHTYNPNRNTLAAETTPLVGPTTKTRDENFRPTSITNPAGHELQMTWSADGANLLSVVDPESNTTSKQYDTQNNLTKVIDPRLNETDYTYNGRLMTSTTNALEQTTTYTYTTEGELNSAGDPQPGGLLKSVTDPAQRTTTYEYDSFGQKIAVKDAQNRITRYTYDSLGRIIDTTDPQGRVTHNEYNDAGLLIRVTRNYDSNRPKNALGVYNIVTEYEYDAAGHQTVVRDTLGHETIYGYDGNGRLVTTTNALGQTSTNVYDEAGTLIETIDAAENSTTYVKDAAGRPVSTLDPQGNGSTITYDVQQNSSTTTDAAGHATVTYFDQNNRVIRVANELGGQTLTTYDGNGNVVTKTDPLDNVTFYEYDALNRIERQTQNYDAARPQNDQGQYNIVTEYIYDAAGNQAQVIDTLGRITFSEYDQYGRLIRTTRNYDTNRPKNDQGQYNIVTEYGYDQNGNQNRVTDTYGHVTYSEYDLLGRLSRQTQNYDVSRPTNDQNQYNLVTQYEYDALGNQVKVMDPSGQVTFKEYDALNRLVRQTQNHDAARPQNDLGLYNIVTVYEYDLAGRQYKVTDTVGRVTLNTYDIAGQMISTTQNYDSARIQNEENQYNIVTSYEYDDAGRLVKETDTYGKVTYYTYDELGRKVSKTENFDDARLQNEGNEFNLVTRYAYDLGGQQTDETDPNGVVTHFEYDALGRLSASVQNYQPGVNPTADINVRIAYTYDALGNRLTRTDPRTNSTTYTYDALGRLASETTPLQHTTSLAYDSLGRVARKTDGNGKIILYEYDALGRQKKIDYPAGEADVSFTYNLQGQPLSMTDGLGTTSWVYDSLGRVTAVTNADGSWVAYTYDALGNRLTVTTHLNASDVTGRTVTNAYDKCNRLTRVTDWQGQQTVYTYDAMGRLKEIHLPNGIVGVYTYNSAGRLVDLVQSRQAEVLASYQYTYDPSGNRLQASETVLWAAEDGFIPPQQFSAVEEGFMAISLAWPDSAIEEEGYTLERSTDGVNWQPIAELPANSLRYVDYGLARRTAYFYRLTAHNSAGGLEEQTIGTMTGWETVTQAVEQEPAELRNLVIDYTYDALNRLLTANYDDGTSFGYTYDASGNTLQAVKTIAGQTTTTSYTYNADNQLATAQQSGGAVWQYSFDGNGSLVESRPGAQPASGAKRYTYNTAGQLVKVEGHDGQGYQPQAEMVYNGKGQRLSLTAYQAGQSLSTRYLLDGSSLLAATADGATTFYLPGIGEEKQDWSYYLYDGTNSARQLSSPAGQVTLTRSFTPWGELLELRGLGDFTWGYLGGLLDAATGLIYVGNGQYYDPATGRFLTRGVYPGSPNPYVPWRGDPLGMMLGPLALVALIRGKRKGGKMDQILMVLIVVLAVNLACDLPGSTPPGTPTIPPLGTGDPKDPGSKSSTPGTTPQPPTSLTPIPTDCTEKVVATGLDGYLVFVDNAKHAHPESGVWSQSEINEVRQLYEDVIKNGYASAGGLGNIETWANAFGISKDGRELRMIIRDSTDVTRAGDCSTITGERVPCLLFSRGALSGMKEPIVAYHEMAHLWDSAHQWDLSQRMGQMMGASYNDTDETLASTDVENHGNFSTQYSRRKAVEDFADTVKNYFMVRKGFDSNWAFYKDWSDDDPSNLVDGVNIAKDSKWFPPDRMDRFDYIEDLILRSR